MNTGLGCACDLCKGAGIDGDNNKCQACQGEGVTYDIQIKSRLVQTPTEFTVNLSAHMAERSPRRSIARKRQQAAQPPQIARKQWFVAKLKADQIHKAETQLVSLGFIPYRPRLPTGELLFPGYALLQFDIDNQTWKPINALDSVQHLLPMHTEYPTPLPDHFIVSIRQYLKALADAPILEAQKQRTEEQILNDLCSRYALDDIVEIKDGPFKGYQAKFRGKKNKSIELLIACLGSETVLYVSPRQLDLSLPSPPAPDQTVQFRAAVKALEGPEQTAAPRHPSPSRA